MKAAQINRYGGSEIVEINNNAQMPSLKAGQVLVKVYAASLNPFDIAIRSGYLKQMFPLIFPTTLGGDFSGVITEVNNDVSNYKVGDKIYGQALNLNGSSGAFAEFAAVNTKNIALKPKKLNYIESASLPLVGTSSIQALEEHIKISRGQKILIHGGAGGIGSIAIQIAKLHGAYVTTTVSTDGEEFVKNLGADEVINYKNQQFEEILKDYDSVFNTAGGAVTDKSIKVLRKGGILVSMTNPPDQNLAKQHEVKVIIQKTIVDTKVLNHLTELADSEKIKAQVDKVFPLDKTKEAFDYLEKGHPKGKVVINIKGGN